MVTPATISAANLWQETGWQGEPAWSATSGPVRAVVSEYRARLIYLGSTDGTTNLLNAPSPCVRPDAYNRWPNQGGHRFWLGPQNRWVWPPPSEWEFSAAESVDPLGEILRLHHPRHDPSYPALTRDYAWEGNRLRCTARWTTERDVFYGMHVVPVDLPFTAETRLQKSAAAPFGFVDVQMTETRTDGFLPHPAVSVSGNHASLRAGLKVLKAGFVPQTLSTARPEGWTLFLHPGPCEGIVQDSPDHGFLSQVWVGGPEHELAELEQLTPFLRGAEHASCSSTIYLEATPGV